MNNQLTIFNNESFKIRAIEINDEPWFLAKDVCDILGYVNSNRVIEKLDDDEKCKQKILTTKGHQEMILINESGFYSLILSSQKPEAKPFKRWVTHEVLPSPRRTGNYTLPKSDKYQFGYKTPKDLLSSSHSNLPIVEKKDFYSSRELGKLFGKKIGRFIDSRSMNLILEYNKYQTHYRDQFGKLHWIISARGLKYGNILKKVTVVNDRQIYSQFWSEKVLKDMKFNPGSDLNPI